MKNIQRSLRALALVALLLLTVSLYAQEATEEPATDMDIIEEPTDVTISVVGSGVVNPVVESLTNASGSTLTYNIETTGTDAGFDAFCADEADVTTAIRPINVEEDTACSDTGVEYLELVVGYEVLAVIGNPEDDFLTCLTADNLDVLLAPSATINNWEALGFGEATAAEGEAEATEEPMVFPDVSLLVPEDTTLAYQNLDGIVAGLGFRSDIQTANVANIVGSVADTSGALGVVPLSTVTDDVALIDLNLVGAGCTTPSVENVEAETYPAATPFYLYVATASQDDLAFFLDYLVSEDATTALSDAGYSPATADAQEINAAIIRGEVAGRANTAEEITYNIPQGLSGNISIVGTLSGFTIADGNASRLTSTQQQLTIDTSFSGQTSGIETFCNGEADILFVNGVIDDLCGGDVASVEYNFGQQAVVVVANPDDSFATCLTPEQLNMMWGASPNDAVTEWSMVSDAFPEQDLILVGLNAGNPLTDILMSNISDGVPLPARIDVAETNPNPLYRAAAVDNVSGALSYMSWVDYQEVLEAGQSDVQLVAINTGDGCVVPSEATILDGSYPLTRNLRMIVNESSLATVPVQSYVWSLFSDANAALITGSDFVGGYQAEETVEFRSDLLVAFEMAEQAQAEAEAEPEATEAVDE